jgi:hypothetical protein
MYCQGFIEAVCLGKKYLNKVVKYWNVWNGMHKNFASKKMVKTCHFIE